MPYQGFLQAKSLSFCTEGKNTCICSESKALSKGQLLYHKPFLNIPSLPPNAPTTLQVSFTIQSPLQKPACYLQPVIFICYFLRVLQSKKQARKPS